MTPGTERGAGDGPGESLQRLELGAQHVELQAHAGVLAGQLLHLLLQQLALALQLLPLRHALDAAAGGVTAVLQRAPPLLQPHHVVLGQPAQVRVELPHRHGHQLVVTERWCILARLLLYLREREREGERERERERVFGGNSCLKDRWRLGEDRRYIGTSLAQADYVCVSVCV